MPALEQIQNTGQELIQLCNRGVRVCEILRNNIETSHQKNVDALVTEYQNSKNNIEQAYANVLKTSLSPLAAGVDPTQEDWNDARFAVNHNTTSGGIASHLIRIGTYPLMVGNKRVRLPVSFDIALGRPLIVAKLSAPSFASQQLFSAIALRFLSTFRPGSLRLHCIDPLSHGSVFNHFLQNLPPHISGGAAITAATGLAPVLDQVESRISFVVQNILGKRGVTLWECNTNAKSPLHEYTLFAVDNLDQIEGPNWNGRSYLDRLARIAVHGARAGVYFICTASSLAGLSKVSPANQLLDNAILLDEANDFSLSEGTSGFSASISPDFLPDTPIVEKIFERISELGQQSRGKSESFKPLPKTDWWKSSCVKTVDLVIGRDLSGTEVVLNLCEDLRTGVILAGDSGSGKSTLLHGLICQMLLKYPPNELNLYLLDLKGTEFGIYQETGSPHVQLILSDMSQKLAVAVLREFSDELQRRSEILKSHQCQKLSDYTLLGTGSPLPRVVIVIDEFFKLFDGEVSLAREVETLISRILRQGRTYGIHLIMASQNLGGHTPSDMKSMFPSRLALHLKNRAEYGKILLDELDLHCEPTNAGEGLFETTNGKQVFFKFPYLAFKTIKPLLGKLSKFVKANGYAQHDVLHISRSERANCERNKELQLAIETGAKSEGLLWLGESFSLGGITTARFRRESDANLLLLCRERNLEYAINVLTAISISLLAEAQHTQIDFVVPRNVTPQKYPLLHLLAEGLPTRVRFRSEGDGAFYQEIASQIQSVAGASSPTRLIVFLGIQHFNLERGTFRSLYGQRIARGTPGPNELLGEALKLLIEDGPRSGSHCVLLADSLAYLDRLSLPRFGLRIGFRMSDTDAQALFGSLDAASLADDAAVFQDGMIAGECVEFRPYVNVARDWLELSVNSLSKRTN